MKTRNIVIFTFLLVLLHSPLCHKAEKGDTFDSITTNIKSSSDSEKINAYLAQSRSLQKSKPSLSNIYANKALNLSKKNNYTIGIVNSLQLLSEYNFAIQNFTASSKHLNEAIDIATKSNISKELLGDLYLNLASTYIASKEFESADQSVLEAIRIFQQQNSLIGSAKASLIYGKLNIALENSRLGLYHLKNGFFELKKAGKQEHVIQSLVYLGESYLEVGIADSALHYLKSVEKINPEHPSSQIDLLIGNAYLEKDRLPEAMSYFQKGLKKSIAQKDHMMHAMFLLQIGTINEMQNNYLRAISSHKKAGYYFELISSNIYLSQCNEKIGNLYLKIGEYSEAKKYFEKSLEHSLSSNSFEERKMAYKGLSHLYHLLKDNRQAFRYYLLYLQMYDSTIKQNTDKEIAIINTMYTKNKEEQEIDFLKKEKEISEMKIKNINSIIYTLGIGFLIIMILAIVFYISSRTKLRTNNLLNIQNKKISVQKEEILIQRNNLEKLYHSLSCQKERIEIQRDLITKKNKNITDGIKYAEMIQKAILPTEVDIKMIFPDSFIIYLPKDIVSGDFYFLEKKENLIYFAAVDCTGHGVPGAFMSLVGFNELSEVLSQNKYTKPDEILVELNRRVNKTLNQNHKDNANKEGMDLALCCYDKENFELEYAGAFNPLYIIRNGILSEYKGDPYPIGISAKNNELEFTNHKIKLLPGDAIYIFTDGYIDQFGGSKRKKFLRKRFRQALLDNSFHSMSEQKDSLIKTFFSWKGKYEQIDDVLVMGIRIPDIN